MSDSRNRIETFYDDLIAENSEAEIAAGLGNGDIDRPEWMGYSEGTDGLKIWDTEDSNASSSWGFMFLSSDDSDDSE